MVDRRNNQKPPWPKLKLTDLELNIWKRYAQCNFKAQKQWNSNTASFIRWLSWGSVSSYSLLCVSEHSFVPEAYRSPQCIVAYNTVVCLFCRMCHVSCISGNRGNTILSINFLIWFIQHISLCTSFNCSFYFLLPLICHFSGHILIGHSDSDVFHP